MKHDKELVRRRFARHLASYDTLASVQRRIARRLAAKLESCLPSTPPAYGIELGAGTGFLTRHLLRLFPRTHWQVNDLTARSRDFLPESPNLRFTEGDGETLSLVTTTERPGVIASASTVQWFDDLPAFVRRAGEALIPGGVLALSSFGPENCREITATAGQSLDYFTLGELEDLFRRNGLELLHSEEWRERLWFDSPVEVLRHLSLTGVNAVSAVRWTPTRLREFERQYSSLFGLPEHPTRVPLTFHPVVLVGKKA